MARTAANSSLSHNAHLLDALSPAQAQAEGFESLAEPAADDPSIFSLSLLVSGVHCAACIHNIEGALLKIAGIRKARLNFSSGRVRVEWQGGREIANDCVTAIQAQGYRVYPYDALASANKTDQEDRFLLLCLGIAAFASGNIMLLSFGLWTTSIEVMGVATRDFMHWVSALIAFPAIVFAGQPFFASAWQALRHFRTNMDVPISLALILAPAVSLWETLHHAEHVYFDSAVMLMFFLLIGRYLDFRARRMARSAATDLLATFADFAIVLEDGKTRRIPARDLKPGMTVLVAAGEKFPADGVITEGPSSVDTSLITGETFPRLVHAGDSIYAGTVNVDAPVQMRVSAAGEQSLLAEIARLMEQATQGQALYVRIADRVARLYTPVVHICALAAFSIWIMAGAPWQVAMMVAVTVLIITCPCALALAVPVVQVLATGTLMRLGVLVKSGDALERMAKIDTLVIDKTGTLTIGKPRLMEESLNAWSSEDLALAVSLAARSAHPLARALREYYGGTDLDVTDVQEYPGQGMEGYWRGRRCRLGKRSWCASLAENENASTDMELWFETEGRISGPLRFKDMLRDDAKATMEAFRRAGIKIILLSGDRLETVASVAGAVGIDTFYADYTPPQKYEFVQELRKNGHRVLMAGDGLNDAPCLAGADVSIAPGTAVDLAQNAADIVFMGEALMPLYRAYSLSCKAQRLVKENFALSIFYNIFAVPAAFCGIITPLLAALAMSSSSLLVIGNSYRLRLGLSKERAPS